MSGNVSDLEQCIRRMAARVRQVDAGKTAMSFGENPSPEVRPQGWWVVAIGAELDANSFEQREQARESLRTRVEAAGVMISEYVWVWDEYGQAQLVISTLPTRERAERLAARLRTKGLDVRVLRERF
ncbi:hypothetical protein [Pseudodesulfovibrio tunisiensis]|uniref:hypothetical protein n=1 Tax=Pseudodesulfovibrio tunisiensis TaxID=463192 RepID=UPI001FB44480|nr:hypothetical protein [Pseudodesulfovibrio tunisiensis]